MQTKMIWSNAFEGKNGCGHLRVVDGCLVHYVIIYHFPNKTVNFMFVGKKNLHFTCVKKKNQIYFQLAGFYQLG